MPANDLTQLTYAGFDLHTLGEITIQEQSSTYMPAELGQRESRQLTVKIETFSQDYADNYNLIQQARAAIQTQNGVLKWTTPSTTLLDGTPIDGDVVLNRPVVIVSSSLPEDLNAWGTYQQSIHIVFTYELDAKDTDVHLSMSFKRTDSVGDAQDLGHIFTFKTGYHASKYSEMHNIRDRAAGSVTATGEIFVGLSETQSSDTRRAIIEAQVVALKNQIEGRDGTLIYTGGGSEFFNQVVRIAAFDAEVNQAVNGMTWSLSADWTKFPNESSYAGADIRVRLAEDRETGEMVLTLSGKIGAPNPVIAIAKQESLKAAVLASNGFPAGLRPIRTESNPRYINSDDTQTNSDGTAKVPTAALGDATSANVFIELEFDMQWRKRSSNLVSWKMTVADEDDTSTGLIRRTYSGSVVASGATADAAYNAAVVQANLLGDKKYAFRVSKRITRSDRKIESNGTQEFLEINFSYEYKIKGERIYIEASTELSAQTFGEDSIRLSGFVVAANYAAAKDAYTSQLKALYKNSLIKAETTSDSKNIIQVDDQWTANLGKGFKSMSVRFDFSLSVFLPKVDNYFSVQYGIRYEPDYVNLRLATTIEGVFYASQVDLANAERAAKDPTVANPLDTFLASLALGVPVSASRRSAHEVSGKTDNSDFKMALQFSQSFLGKLPQTSQVLQCELSEEIQYTGVRNQFMSIPSGPDIPQECGITRGSRAISGTVTASTETACMQWIKNQRQLAFPSGPGGGAQPAKRYFNAPNIKTDFVSLPLTTLVGRGTGANAQFVKKTFSFTEHLVSFPYVDGGSS